jgi:hypothetical protein
MQLYKVHLASTQMLTIVGGFLGSMIFLLLSTVSPSGALYQSNGHVIFLPFLTFNQPILFVFQVNW